MAPNPQPQSKSNLDDLWTLFSNHSHPTTLSHLATLHHQTHHRPFRIALDQNTWNYTLTRSQELKIQKSQRKSFHRRKRKAQSLAYCNKYTPLQKPTLFRREIDVLVRLMKYISLGIEFYVIFPSPLEREAVGVDGDRYSHANGRVHVWYRILGDLGIRFHAAEVPVAECAWMMERGVVDAVWTNDCEGLAFCGDKGMVVGDCDGEVRVYKMEEVRRRASWEESVLIHILARSGFPVKDVINTDIIQDLFKEAASKLCKCSNQEELDEWFNQLQIPPDLNITLKPPDYEILKAYLHNSVSARSKTPEARLFRQKCRSRMKEIKDTHADALAFYNSNLADRTRRLWEYTRDTFSMKGTHFLELMAGVLLARGELSGGIEDRTSVDEWTVQVSVKIAEQPVLWGLRIKMTEDINGVLVNPVILKILMTGIGNSSNKEIGEDASVALSKENTSVPEKRETKRSPRKKRRMH
ncbi:hypothetical protein TWF481_004412 [Arthrobotrys musiformis]|uniref:XPG-I domain-containing protein n=1 Tax=Arthrobotrys musiformis TaxID=47236 RepID=A0AAV9WJH6_9PEZI